MRQIIVGLMIFAFFGMLIISVWYGTRVSAATISTVTIKGGETIPHENVEAIVRARLDGAYLKLVPKTFAFTYPHDDIEAGVREIKRIKNLSIVRLGGTEILVEFDEYLPHALWCAGSSSDGCFFLDDAGYSFSPAPSLTGGSFMRFVAIGRSPSEHVQAFSPEDYNKVQELVTLMSEVGWHVEKAEVDAAGDAFLKIVDGGEFKVTLKQTAKETVDNLTTVLNSEKFAHIKPGNFEYVDLRFGDKVFVNEVTLETTASSTMTSNGSTSPATTSNITSAPAEESATPAPVAEESAEAQAPAPAPAPDTGVTITF
jgi:cell division septal protein FtsQ